MGRVELKELLTYMLRDAKVEIKKFNRKTYDEQFEALYSKHMNTLVEVENLYHLEDDSVEVLEDLATVFAEYAFQDIETMKKREKQIAVVDYNMAMVSYIFPMIDRRRDAFMSVFADKCVLSWNGKFPKTAIGKSTKAEIDGGFKNKLCYITTAVCESMNKADDCYELNLLREYRDGYLMNESESGEQIVREYYDMAPTIVKRINREQDSVVIYQGIWDEYLHSCIQLIEENKMEETQELYSAMVRNLADKYLY